MRRFARLAVAIAATVMLTAAGQQAPRRMYQSYGDDQLAALARVSAYLNSIHSLKASFVQIGPEGGMNQGTLYIQKPGQIRFEYAPPSPQLIVATGGSVYVRNSRLNTVDRYDLSDTPLGLLLDNDADLSRNRAVTGIAEQDGAVIVSARTSTNRNDSNITLVFSAPGLELRQWTVKDNQGGRTTVALQNVQAGATLDPALFTVPVKGPPAVRRPPNG